MLESFNKIKNETFFTSPPFSYRPSLAGYLANFSVDKKAFISDILHLDQKKKIKIIDFNDYSFTLKLIDSSELDSSEIFIWDYLTTKKNKEEICEIIFSEISNITLTQYSFYVRLRYQQKFYLGKEKIIGKISLTEAIWNYFLFSPSFFANLLFIPSIFFIIFLFIFSAHNPVVSSIPFLIQILILFGGFLTMISAGLFVILTIGGIVKSLSYKTQKLFFIKKFVLKYGFIFIFFYFTLICLISVVNEGAFGTNPLNNQIVTGLIFSLGLMNISILSRYIPEKNIKLVETSSILAYILLLLFIPSFFLIFEVKLLISSITILILLCYLLDLQYDYITWITENKIAHEHRTKWIEFSKFIKERSGMTYRTPKHYILWGPFYYYFFALNDKMKFEQKNILWTQKGILFWLIAIYILTIFIGGTFAFFKIMP